jgi:hypothetical protein
MRIISNEKLIKRNKLIGQVTTIASLAILVAGLIASFTPKYLSWSFVALVGGFILSQVGIYFGNRWGRSPRSDEKITAALKGLGDQYSLYHYTSPVPHLLVGPAGLLILLPFYQGGTITYNADRKRWKQKGGNTYLKLFGQESLGRPDLEASTYITDMQNWLSKNFPGQTMPIPEAILIFTNPKADLQTDGAPIPTMMEDKVKDFIRRKAKTAATPAGALINIQAVLPKEEHPEKLEKGDDDEKEKG